MAEYLAGVESTNHLLCARFYTYRILCKRALNFSHLVQILITRHLRAANPKSRWSFCIRRELWADKIWDLTFFVLILTLLHPPMPHYVSIRVVEYTLRPLPVPPGAARFLVVPLDRFRHRVVNYEAYVCFIHTHAECYRRTDLGNESLLSFECNYSRIG